MVFHRSWFAVLAAAVLGMTAESVRAQGDITAPTDLIELISGTDDGDGFAGDPPAAEGVANALDNTTAKYLHFQDLGSGFKVTPGIGESVVSALRIYTANDSAERDPASYLFEGSNDGTNFVTIASGGLALPQDRNPASALTPIDPSVHFHQTVAFPNTTPYTSYRLTFPTLRDAALANSMQVAEVELLGLTGDDIVADANGDGVVDLADFDLIRTNFRRTVTAGENGDVNFTAVVDFEDFRLWKAAFGGGPSNVPEPSTISLILIAGAGVFLAGRGRIRG